MNNIDAGSIAQIVSTAIIMLGIPWAMKIVRELALIRGDLNGIKWQETAINKLQEDVRTIELQLAARGE